MSQTFLQGRVNAIFPRASGGQQRPACFDIDHRFPALRGLGRCPQELKAMRRKLKRCA